MARMTRVDSAGSIYFTLASISALPNLEQCTHKTGRFWFTVTNYGILGNRGDALLRDCLTGGFSSSAEFPGGSQVEYLFQGALWVGGIVGGDTLTSIGNDGWVNIREFFPEAGVQGNIIRRSANSSNPFYSPEAVSDLDLIAVFYDTLKDPRLVTTPDPEDGKLFRPLGLKVEQRSYSWAAGWGQDWVLLDYTITNIGQDPIRNIYAGIFMDPDVGSIQAGRVTHADDYSGFKAKSLRTGLGTILGRPVGVCEEALNIAYAFDNDGDPDRAEAFGLGSKSPTGVFGVRVLRAGGESLRPDGSLRLEHSFNWWVPDSSGVLDWGPQHTPERANSTGRLGQPMGDRMRYHYLSNQEIDYEQIYSAINQNPIWGGIWTPPLSPQSSALEVANGADSRFLLSVGSFDLDVGESLPFTLAVLAGAGFHTSPTNFSTHFPLASSFLDSTLIDAYKAKINLGGLIEGARMAQRVFDNETDTSSAVCRSEFQVGGNVVIIDTLRPHGDGIPDFRGPLPPPYPKVNFSQAEGEVTIRWFGRQTENAADPVTGLRDFEGYAVLMSTDGINYVKIGQWDEENWRVYYLNRDADNDSIFQEFRWEPLRNNPLTYDEIQNYYAVRWDTCKNKPGAITKPIRPEKFFALTSGAGAPLLPSPNPWCDPDSNRTAVRVRFCDRCGPFNLWVDTLVFFKPEGPNTGFDQIRIYPSVTDPANDSSYWYQFKISGLLPSLPVWFAVVAFDNGMVTFHRTIEPQEAPPVPAARLIHPIAAESARQARGLKISVYPNPYRIDHDYSFFEKHHPVSGHPQSSKRINFINLPPRCTIRVYTLDGDLVQQINHDKDPNASDASYESWDLLTRNAQMVVAGLYLFTVDSDEGRYIGKIVIIQ